MNKEELTMLGTKLSAKKADEFRAYAAENGTTVSRLLSTYIRDTLSEAEKEPAPCEMNRAVLTYRNVERLKHEVAFHNPDHLNPDKMLNHILDRYFEMVEDVRRTTK